MTIELTLCPYCKEHQAFIVPVIYPIDLAAYSFDHLPDCPFRELKKP